MTCLAPALTMTSPADTAKPCALANHSATALRNWGVPSTAVYLVAPLSSAHLAASLMWLGVSKSGSPAAKLMTSTPWERSSAAFAVTFMVIDGATEDRRFASPSGMLRNLPKLLL